MTKQKKVYDDGFTAITVFQRFEKITICYSPSKWDSTRIEFSCAVHKDDKYFDLKDFIYGGTYYQNYENRKTNWIDEDCKKLLSRYYNLRPCINNVISIEMEEIISIETLRSIIDKLITNWGAYHENPANDTKFAPKPKKMSYEEMMEAQEIMRLEEIEEEGRNVSLNRNDDNWYNSDEFEYWGRFE